MKVPQIVYYSKISLDSDPRNYFITSDLHFYHEKVMGFCPYTRPWDSVEEMNNALIAEWNGLVGEDDVVFFLGDFSWGSEDEIRDILSQLNGWKVIIRGNHDRHFRGNINKGEHGIIYIGDALQLTIDKKPVHMSHFPMATWDRQFHGGLHFYGHVHGNYDALGKAIDVGYDRWGYILPLEAAMGLVNSRDFYVLPELQH